MKISIRQSLIAVALLGALTCVVSLVALTRLIATTTTQRVERARDIVLQQLDVIRRTDDAVSGSGAAPAIAIPTMLGMRGGVIAAGTSVCGVVPELDASACALVDDALARSAASHAPALGQAATEDSTLVVGARPTARGAFAWMVYPVVPPRWILAWRVIGFTLGLAGLALVVASIHLAVSVQRGAAALGRSLSSLGRDLTAPVARPKLRELADVADGITALAAELRTAQKEQARLNRELADQRRLAALGRVAAGVAHEVRNPLASIKLRLDLARMDAETPPALVRELADASTEIARLDRFVADLLTVAGRRTGPRAPTDLAQLAAQRVGVVAPWARERGVKVGVSGSASASIDGDAIGRVIDNLVRNAVEASQHDGGVEVTVSNGGDDAHVVVSDCGPGVDPARAHELFEPFFTTKTDGTGLGLALSRAIASAHGGSLVYERRDDATRFSLTLPVTRASGEASSE